MVRYRGMTDDTEIRVQRRVTYNVMPKTHCSASLSPASASDIGKQL